MLRKIDRKYEAGEITLELRAYAVIDVYDKVERLKKLGFIALPLYRFTAWTNLFRLNKSIPLF
ncbi:MAG: hypothetical protein JXR30_03460 [Alphaproteobacteria bacterium]|nr:hypothetical protein [Alphaproteobacteria bacterium]